MQRVVEAKVFAIHIRDKLKELEKVLEHLNSVEEMAMPATKKLPICDFCGRAMQKNGSANSGFKCENCGGDEPA